MEIIKESDKSWVGVQDEKKKKFTAFDLKKKINQVQVWFFDLDDNHCYSPSKKVAYKALGTSYFSPKFVGWGLQTGLALLSQGKKAESKRWKSYVDSFLTSDESKEKLEKIFTIDYAKKTIYTGVQEFCKFVHDLESNTDSLYITRTVEEIARPYAKVLGVDSVIARADDKAKVVEQYLKENPHIKIFGVDGDSEEDADMIERIKFYEKEAIGIYSMKSKKAVMNEHFDLATSKDRSTLVKMLKE